MPVLVPKKNCQLCPRLAEFRNKNSLENGDWFNGAVPSFGENTAKLLIVGLAPGLKGANRTGRPFTGDYAGDLLYATLNKFGFSKGQYNLSSNDGLELKQCRITNAVRCVPPQNKPIGDEIKKCRPFLAAEIEQLKQLKVIICLGRIAHESLLTTLEAKKSSYPFVHAATHKLPTGHTLIDSYHCSRYNTNTGRLTTEMFETVFERAKAELQNA